MSILSDITLFGDIGAHLQAELIKFHLRTPDNVGKSECSMERLISVLQKNITAWEQIFEHFIQKLESRGDQIESDVVLKARYDFTVTYKRLIRVHNAVEKFIDEIQTLSREEAHLRYLTRVNIPMKEDAYHPSSMNGNVTTPNVLMRLIYHLGVQVHLKHTMAVDKVPYNSTATQHDNISPRDSAPGDFIPIVKHIFDYACCLESFPILPDNLYGKSVATQAYARNKPDVSDLKLIDVGADNYARVLPAQQSLTTCTACLMFSLSSGVTDAQESREKLTCGCTMKSIYELQNFSDEVIGAFSGVIRCLMLKSQIDKDDTFGCGCEVHQNLLGARIQRLSVLLPFL